MKNKKGISIMIGYILLISVAVFIGIIVYSLLKTYIPSNTPKCPEDVSLEIQSTDCTTGKLELTLENTGLFTINGYFIKAKTNSNSKISTVDLGEATKDGLNLFVPSLEPEKTSSTQSFKYDSDVCTKIGGDCSNNKYTIYSIEITPMIATRDDNGKLTSMICSDAKAFKELSPCEIS